MTEKTTEHELSQLLAKVAKVLTEQIGYKQDVVLGFDEEGIPTSTEARYSCPPATLAAAIKLLKDNDITCDKELEGNLTGLKEELARKQKRSLGDPRLLAALENTH
jgi:hypothetical protein